MPKILLILFVFAGEEDQMNRVAPTFAGSTSIPDLAQCEVAANTINEVQPAHQRLVRAECVQSQ